jgi:hypothetical protein
VSGSIFEPGTYRIQSRSAKHSIIRAMRLIALMMEAARISETLVNFYQIIVLLMEAARISEKLVNFYQTTRRYNPEDNHLRTHAVRTSNPTWITHECVNTASIPAEFATNNLSNTKQ